MTLAAPCAPTASRARQWNVRPDPGQRRRPGSEAGLRTAEIRSGRVPPPLGCELSAGVRGGVRGSGTTSLVLLEGLGYPLLDELQDIQLLMGQPQRETAIVAGPGMASPGFSGARAGSSRAAGFRICGNTRLRFYGGIAGGTLWLSLRVPVTYLVSRGVHSLGELVQGHGLRGSLGCPLLGMETSFFFFFL